MWKTLVSEAVATAALVALANVAHGESAPVIQASVSVDSRAAGPLIDRHVFGQFMEFVGRGIYEGVWVGEESPIPNDHGYRTDVLAALKDLHVPIVRWPGGCFADRYHWRDGVGPRSERLVTMNSSWGGEESNAFGSGEYFGLLERLGADAYLGVNVGSGSPREMAEWLEYLTASGCSSLAELRRQHGRVQPYRVSFLGLGNESWGCGGNMRAEFYADELRRFSAFVPTEQKPLIVASGPNADDYAWTEGVMSRAADVIDSISLHYYTVPSGDWDHKGPATGFDESAWASSLSRARKMDELIARHSAIMDRYDPKRRVSLSVDEWGTWYDKEESASALFQQNTLRDAVAAAVTLNIFARHADRVHLAAIAQMANVLQAMILTDGPRMILTPTYDVFWMYRPFQDSTALPVNVGTPEYAVGSVAMPAVDAIAARGKDGLIHLALVNLDPRRKARVRATFAGVSSREADGWILTAAAMDAHNTFDDPDAVRRKRFRVVFSDGSGMLDLPAKSVVVVTLHS